MDATAIPEPEGWEDPLTGLEGPDLWQRVLVTEVTRALRYGRALTVVVVEVDGIPEMAETWGIDVARHVAPRGRPVPAALLPHERLLHADRAERASGSC